MLSLEATPSSDGVRVIKTGNAAGAASPGYLNAFSVLFFGVDVDIFGVNDILIS